MKQLATVLVKTGVLSAEQLSVAQKRADETKLSLREIVIAEMKVTEDALTEAIAQYYRVPHVRLAAATVDPEAVKLLPEDKARKFVCLPIKKEDVVSPGSPNVKRRPILIVAISDPSDLMTIQQLEFATGSTVKVVVASQTEINDAIGHYYSPEDWIDDFLRNVQEDEGMQIFSAEEENLDEKNLSQDGKQPPAVKMANLLIQNAIHASASDIHIEPGLNHVQVRNRVQGLLREFMQVPKWLQEPLVSRIKILAKLDIAERRVPQDGRIKVVFRGREVDLRVSTLPTHFGEKVVMRILGSGQTVPATGALGLNPQDLEILTAAFGQPQGLILVTGPTGSGKTTTLYSILQQKRSPDINIITVEDPIEFQVPGINQVQVNTKAGLTFASSLRSILRQDPDVILVGEIRDLETAEISFHAALTGHLVLSTLHTNGTVATIGRLLDIGVDPQLIASSINLIVAQRLLRKLCQKCKQPHKPDAKMLQRLQLDEAKIEHFAPKGCESCQNTGFAGRVGIYELLRITPNIKDLIQRKGSESDITEAAARNGMVTLLAGSMALVREGATTVEEVLRVIQLQDDGLVRCPSCAMHIDRDFAACPYCAHTLKSVCESCEQQLKPGWKICPYCSTPVASGAAEAAAAPPKQAPAGHAAPEPPPPPAPEAPKVPKVLVVDDDPVMRAIITRGVSLLPQKPQVLEAANGQDALLLAESSRPDIIILDVMMPGMSGLEVCQTLRSSIATAFVPIIMLTASTDEETRSKGFLVGTDDFMSKPLSVPELHARVNRLLRRTYGM